MSRIRLAAGILLFTAGCGQITAPDTASTATPSSPRTIQAAWTPGTALSPTQGSATQMVQPLPTSPTSGAENLIEKAKQDLAQRLSVPVDEISLVEVIEMEWADSSLGCPEPDMMYLQVITPSYRILLESNAQVYEYHTNKISNMVYCEDSDSYIRPPKP